MTLNLSPQPGDKKQQFKLAMRLAWRDIRRNRGRSVLIAALIAVPIMMISAALVVGFSKTPTTEETIAAELGKTAGRVGLQYSPNSSFTQGPKGDLSSVLTDEDVKRGEEYGSVADFQDLILPDFELVPLSNVDLATQRDKATLTFNAVIGDILNPAFEGKFKLLEGRNATGDKEALASPGFMERFDVHLGEQFTTVAGDFTIVGTVRDSGINDAFPTFFVSADQMPDNFAPSPEETQYYLVGEKSASWALATELNQRGAILTSADLLRNPPTEEQVGATQERFADAPSGNGLELIAMGALISALAMLEVGLLAGAAFAVGTRKQQRELALLAASGAEASTLRSVVTSSGLWLGLLGGITGALTGTGIGIAWVLHKIRSGENLLWLHIPWLMMIGVVLVGLISGLAAAYAPSRAVSKQVLNVSLKSVRTTHQMNRKTLYKGIVWLVSALLLLAFSASISFFGIVHDFELRSYLALALVIMGSIGLITAFILLTAPILKLMSSITSWLPLPLRLATRDAARNTGRTVPAVAAVLAAATLSSALLVYWSSVSKSENENYEWSYNLNQMALPLSISEFSPSTMNVAGLSSNDGFTTRKIDADAVTKSAVDTLGPSTNAQTILGTITQEECINRDPDSVEVEGIQQSPNCSSWALMEPVENQCLLASDGKPIDLQDWRCRGSMSSSAGFSSLPEIIVGDEGTLRTLLGRNASTEALQTLKSGGAVISNPVYLNKDNTTTLISYDIYADPQEPVTASEDSLSSRESPAPQQSYPLLATVEEPTKPLPYYAVISPETASRIGLPFDEQLVLLSLAEVPSDAAYDSLLVALADIAGDNYGPEELETGPRSDVTALLWLLVGAAALVTFSATGITAGLAMADGREDQSVLASIGADPRLRKSLSASQLFLTSILGTLFGTITGLMAAGTLQLLFREMTLVVPWMQLAVMLIVIPLVGSAIAWVLTKGQLTLLRRRTIA